MARRKRKSSATPPPLAKNPPSRIWRSIQWLGAAGFLVAAFNVTYQYFGSNVQLEFIQPLSRGYEFQIKNDTPSDRTIKKFRVVIPVPQKSLYRITQDINVERNAKGETVFPGGNITHVPAAEFKELDGQKIVANSSMKFRLPPLAARSWLEPEASIIDIRYELEPTNPALQAIELLFGAIGIYSRDRTVRYLVLGNYWVVSQSASLNEAIRVACRDDESIAKISACNAERTQAKR